MKYPRLTKTQDRRCKLTEKDIAKMRKLKLSIPALAKKFKVSRYTVHYWTDENFRQRCLTLYKTHRKNYTNPKDLECSRESKEYSLRVNPKLREYSRITTLKNKLV